MVQINFALKEVNCKVVYYGPGLSGKTTNLEVVHSKAPKTNVGDLTSIATEGDRTLFFDFLPLNLGSVAGMTTKFQIYTVPGQVYYNSTRKLVLQGADGIVFVADSRRGKMDENLEAFANLEDNLREYGMDIRSLPLVMQYNKRDFADVYSVEELEEKLNKQKVPYFEAVAVTGEGVFPTLKKLSQMVLESLNRQPSSRATKVPKKKADVKEPVAVAADKKAAEESARVSASPRAGSARISVGSDATPGKQAAQKAPAATVLKEPVTSSPGIKPIERKALTPDRIVRKRPAAEVRAALSKPRKGKRGVAFAIVLLLVAVAAAVLYFTGLLDSFLGK